MEIFKGFVKSLAHILVLRSGCNNEPATFRFRLGSWLEGEKCWIFVVALVKAVVKVFEDVFSTVVEIMCRVGVESFDRDGSLLRDLGVMLG